MNEKEKGQWSVGVIIVIVITVILILNGAKFF